MYRLGLSTTGKVVCDELFENYKKAGFSAAEVCLGLEGSKTFDSAELRALADKYGIELWSFHLPFMPFEELDISKAELADKTISLYEDIIDRATSIGINKFVVHPSGEPVEDHERRTRLECSKKSLARLAEYAKARGAHIAVEDLPRSCIGNCIEEIGELVSVHPDLKICFDTNHLLSDDPIEFIRRFGDRIITLHVSDYDSLNDRHWLPGEGDVDWATMLNTLCEVGYSGVWMYEVKFKAPRSIIRDRDLTCEDIAKNAREIFEGKKPTGIGTRTEGLKIWSWKN